MKIALVSHHTLDHPWDKFSAVTATDKQIYADKHGYKFFNKTDNFLNRPGRHLSYEKMPFLLELMHANPDIDWFWYSGCDVLLTNHDTKLESLIDENYSFIITKDGQGINGDVFFVRNNSVGRAYIERMDKNEGEIENPESVFPEDRAAGRWTTEQGWLNEDERNPEWSPIFKYLPQHTMNSYELKYYGGSVRPYDLLGQRAQWEPGDFAVHAITGYHPGLNKVEINEWKLNMLLSFIHEHKNQFIK
jgi:hypothetical protein